MPVPSTVNDLDPVASNNSPAGSEPIGPDLDAYLRAHAAIIRQVSDASNVGTQTHAATSKATPVDADELPIADSASSFSLKKLTWANLKAAIKTYLQGGMAMSGLLKFAAGASIASSATVDLTAATGNTVHITGTTTITGWTLNTGQFMNVIFDGSLQLTHNATTNNLPNAGNNITTAAGDRAKVFSDGTTVYVYDYTRANGTALVSSGGNQLMSLVAAVSTTSGTAIDFTGIPSWAKKITVVFNGVSTNGASITQVQIGSSAVQNSGYQAAAIRNVSNAASQAGATSGFILTTAQSAADIFGGSMILSLLGSNTWGAQFSLGYASSYASTGGGSVTLSGTLDRIRLTTVNGTDAFDAGSMSILIEGY